MPEHRRYTKRQKMTAVVAAEMTSQEAASEAMGIPRKTISYWMDDPELAALRHNAREQMTEETMLVARLAWRELAKRIRSGDIETRDLVLATGMATDKAQLLSGEPTARTENKSITDGLDDHERQALNGAILGELARRSDARTAESAVGPVVEAGAATATG